MRREIKGKGWRVLVYLNKGRKYYHFFGSAIQPALALVQQDHRKYVTTSITSGHITCVQIPAEYFPKAL